MFYRVKILKQLQINKISNTPINYILQNKYYFNFFFKILYPILIPRIDTEMFIETFNHLFISNFKNTTLDLCCGSGNIGTSLKLINRNIKITLIDNNYITFSLTYINYKNTCKNSNALHYIKNIKKYNNILTNPPYLCLKHLKFYLKFNKKKKSLYANLTGLNVTIPIINNIYNNLKKNGNLTIEHSYNQAKKIRYLLNLSGFNNIQTLKNISNINRLIYAEK